MNDYTLQWLSQANLIPDSQLFERRQQGIEVVADKVDAESVPELARLAYDVNRVNADFLQSFRSWFRESDLTFPNQGNDAEVRILASCSIAELLILHPGVTADIVALAIITRSLNRTTVLESTPELLTLAKQYLDRRAVDVRAPQISEPVTIPRRAKSDIPELMSNLEEQIGTDNVANFKEPLLNVIRKITEYVDILNTQTTNIAQHMRKEYGILGANQTAVQEETNILWWVFNGQSHDLGRPYKMLEVTSAIFPSARELAELTKIFPGPLRAEMFLAKLLSETKGSRKNKTSIKYATNACNREWRAQFANEYQPDSLAELLPVVCAIHRSLETEGEDDWLPPYMGTTGVDAEAAMSHVDLSQQLFNELTLIRASELSQ